MWRKLRDLLAGSLFSKMLLAVANIWVIRELSPNDFALFNNFLSVQAFVAGLIFTPFLMASVAKANLFQIENKRRLLNALNIIQTIGILGFTLIVWLVGPGSASFLFQNPAYFISLILGLLASIFLTLQNLVLSEHQSNESFGIYNLVNVARPVLILTGLGICLAFNQITFVPVAIVFMVSSALAVVNTGRELMNPTLLRGFFFKFLQLKWFWTQARTLILFFFVISCVDHIGLFISTRFFSLEEAAGYGVAFRYYGMADLIIASSHVLFLSSFTKNDPQKTSSHLARWTKIMLPVGLAIFVILPWLSNIYVLINREIYANTFPLVIVFAGGLVAYLSFSPAIYALIGQRSYGFLLVISLLAVALQTGFSVWGIHTHSLWFIAFGTVLARGFIYFLAWIRVYLQPHDR